MENRALVDFWNKRAEVHGPQFSASMRDTISIGLEISQVLTYLVDGERVLDAGCANGAKAFIYAKERKIALLGIDKSSQMMVEAKKLLKEADGLKGSVEFEERDLLEIEFEAGFDKVITSRVLVNILDKEKQKDGIIRIHRALKPGGTYLMLECTTTGVRNINTVRASLRLDKLPIPPWHNLYFEEDDLIPFLEKFFDITKVNRFNSTYYLVSRTINALLNTHEGDADYLSDINKIAAQLPAHGDYGPSKLFVLKKKP